MLTYLAAFSGGPCSGIHKIPEIPHFWFLKCGTLWYYYRLDSKSKRVVSEEEVEEQKINTIKKYNPYSKAKNRHRNAKSLNVQATFVYVDKEWQGKDENNCDVVTFKEYHLREFGVELAHNVI